MKVHVFCLSCVLMICGADASAAVGERQISAPVYREGQPETLSPQAEAPAPVDMDPARLREALATAKSPRFVLMWNKALSDNVLTEYEAVSQTAAVAQVTTPPPTVTILQESRTGTKAVREAGESTSLEEGDDWTVRGGFEHWLIGAGMNLVDRKVALREAGIAVDGDQPNLQKVEIQALKAHADYMLEVLSTPAPGPVHAKFRIRVSSLKTGRTVASLTSNGDKPTTIHTRYEASSKGYEKVADRSITTIDEIGAQLARELAEQLVRTNLSR